MISLKVEKVKLPAMGRGPSTQSGKTPVSLLNELAINQFRFQIAAECPGGFRTMLGE